MKSAVNTHCTIFQEELSQGQRQRRAGKYNIRASVNLHVVGGKSSKLALLALGLTHICRTNGLTGTQPGQWSEAALPRPGATGVRKANGRKGKLQFRKKVCNPDCHDVR